MACVDCQPDNVNLNDSLWSPSNNCGCPDTNDCNKYNGPDLPCSGIETGDTYQDALAKLDQAVCTATGDYSTYNTFCLAPITTAQQFVEGISEFVCTLKDDFDTFTTTTFTDYQAVLDARFEAIETPAITCASAGITSGDDLAAIYTKYCTKFTEIDDAIDISSVTWDNCFSVVDTPTTIGAGFQLLADQICNLESLLDLSGGDLPVFNNSTSCLPSPGSADSLVDTVNKIKSRLCESPTFDINALTWACVSKPSSTTTDLQSAFQAILDKLDSISQNMPTFDGGDFDVSNVDDGDLCLGKSIALAVPSDQDKFVAINGSDGTPGYLANKLTAGTNITLDIISSPGEMIINSTGGSSTDDKVKSYSGDPSSGYLDAKIVGGVSNAGVSVTTSTDTINNQIKVNVSVNVATLITSIISTIETDDDVKNAWCNLIATCPSPCAPPSNIEVTYSTETTTTSTTTTTL